MNMSDVHFQPETATLEGGADAIAALVIAARRLRASEKSSWAVRLEHTYGDLQGQRAFDIGLMNKRLKQKSDSFQSHEVVLAIEAYFSLICLLLAAASLQSKPEEYLISLGNIPVNNFRVILSGVFDGSEFEKFSVYGLREAFELRWVCEVQSDEELGTLQSVAFSLAEYWSREIEGSSADDFTQPIHSALFPKNLVHSSGQFFSPAWLVDRLVEDVNWDGNGLFIDPFCGSGIFLLRAIRLGMKRGQRLEDLLKRCIGIDVSPVATVAAQCNLIIMIARFRTDPSERVSINILNADSLAPAIVKGISGVPARLFDNPSVRVGSDRVFISDFADHSEPHKLFDQLAVYGLDLQFWEQSRDERPAAEAKDIKVLSVRDRKILEQIAVFYLSPADVLGTNPPWVGWEYMARSYRAELQPAWDTYGLFNSTGLQASFLKEDLSTVATVASWDLYLKDGGRSVVIIKPSTMKADLTGRGIRRLSVFPERDQICLELVREFEGIDVFQDAKADACSLQILKGSSTKFPVPVKTWSSSSKRLKLSMSEGLETVQNLIQEIPRVLDRTDPDDLGSRWMIADGASLNSFERLRGKNTLVPRMGVFTGGANAVFYVERLSSSERQGVSKWKNVTERAKRFAPDCIMMLEDALVRPVLRGRDIQPWHATPGGKLIFPHSNKTLMLPLEEEEIRHHYPLVSEYLNSHREILEIRKGFAGWEKKIHEKYFYSLQRIGEYTFLPYKVCWKYIASEFVVCVLGADEIEFNVLPNDKVMFIGFTNKIEAFYYGGVLSSKIARSFINSGISKRQISANAIRALRVPKFEAGDELHHKISLHCLDGHLCLSGSQVKAATEHRLEVDGLVERLYSRQ